MQVKCSLSLRFMKEGFLLLNFYFLLSIRIPIPRRIDLLHKVLDLAVGFVGEIPFLLEVSADKEGDGLIEAGIYAAFVFLDDLIAVITGLAIDQLHQHFSLVNRKIG